MAKHVFTLDDVESEFSDLAMLLFRTGVAGYIFTDSLNRLYSLSLARVDDLPIAGMSWPTYTFDDRQEHLKYFLVEHPLSSSLKETWQPGDKMLIVRGETAWNKIRQIHAEFTEPQPDDNERHELLMELIQQFTVATPIDLEAPCDNLPTKAAKERRQLEQRCMEVLRAIEDYNLDLDESELQHLNSMKERWPQGINK